MQSLTPDLRKTAKMRECLDTSVVVKWFKGDEKHAREANLLFQRVKDFKAEFVANEWLILELVRGLVKTGARKEAVDGVYDTFQELVALGALNKIPVSSVLGQAKDLELELNLYAADAVHLATALTTRSAILWTEDHHLAKPAVKEYAKHHRLKIKSLAEKTR